MQVSVSEAKGQLTELVRRAEAGEEIVLTRRGRPAVRLVAERLQVDSDQRAAALDAIYREAQARLREPGPSAARSQDFLYDDDGLPA